MFYWQVLFQNSAIRICKRAAVYWVFRKFNEEWYLGNLNTHTRRGGLELILWVKEFEAAKGVEVKYAGLYPLVKQARKIAKI